MDEATEDLDFQSLLCDEVGDEVFRQLEEEEAAEKTQKGAFTITSSSDTKEAAEEEEQKKSVSKLETNNRDLSNTVYLRVVVTELCSPPVPTVLLYFLEPPVSIQPTLPQPQSIKRPHSPLPPHSVPQQDPWAPEIDTQCPKGGDQAPSCPPLSGTESPDIWLPPTPKKRERTNYSTDQVEILETLFHEDPFPEMEKKKLIADSLGVTVKNISTWFQNRRSRGKKEDAANRKLGAGQSRIEYSPHHKICPIQPIVPSSLGASPSSTQTPSAHRSLLSSLGSPDQSRVRPAHTSPLTLGALAGGSTSAHCETLSLPIDTSKQSSTYHLQISYSAIQPATSPPSTQRPSIANLTPKPPNSNLTSYLTFGPGGNPTGVVTVSVISFQSQSTDMQSSDQHAGTAACQSHRDCRGPDEGHQPPSSVSLPQPEASLFQESSHENSQHTLLSKAHTSTTTVLPPVSALQLSYLNVEDAPPEELLQPEVSAASTESPPVSSEIDYNKYDKIHSHFHCDVSPTHFCF